VLTEPRYRQRLAEVREDLKRAGGVTLAATLTEAALGGTKETL
jgi:zeaxanthin glucosyltransferase